MSDEMSDELMFAGEPPPESVEADPWKILVADDEEDVHRVTRLVLSDLRFHGRSLEIIDAYDGAETVEMLRAHADVAVILLDIVMETETAGWDVVRKVRDELGNHQVRIIVRTGYHGSVSEQRIIEDYEINDYRGKGELTRERMFVAISSALQAYQGLEALNNAQVVLERLSHLIDAVAGGATLEQVAGDQLHDFAAALQLTHALVICERANGDAAQGDCRHHPIVAGVGQFENLDSDAERFGLSDEVYAQIEPGLAKDIVVRPDEDGLVISRVNAAGRRVLCYLPKDVSELALETHAVEWFVNSIAAALEFHATAEDIIGSLRTLMSSLSDAAEVP